MLLCSRAAFSVLRGSTQPLQHPAHVGHHTCQSRSPGTGRNTRAGSCCRQGLSSLPGLRILTCPSWECDYPECSTSWPQLSSEWWGPQCLFHRHSGMIHVGFATLEAAQSICVLGGPSWLTLSLLLILVFKVKCYLKKICYIMMPKYYL